MGKRCLNVPLFQEELSDMISPALDIQPGIVLTDILGKNWKLGKTVGTGGFGEIYLASDSIYEDVDYNSQYVAKVERHTSGPLFVEIHCYLNIAKSETLQNWINNKKLAHLGMPHYVASGSHTVNGIKYRFLILPRFTKDLHHIFESKNCKFNLKTVLTIARQVIDVLEYIHSKGYIHSDIKASNILLGANREIDTYNKIGYGKYRGITPMRACKLKKIIPPRVLRNTASVMTRNFTRPTKLCSIDKLYLVDYGLVTKYVTNNGEHKQFCSDNRKAHAGTILFCSRDGHEGAQSRRSDLECLGYNLIYWLTSSLPWCNDLEDHDLVYKKKQTCIDNLKNFLEFCFDYECPRFLYNYFSYLQKLKFDAQPDYNYCKNLFKNALSEYGFKDNLLVDFDNLECQLGIKKIKHNVENLKVKRQLALQKLKRSPLKSNLPLRPRLRKQLNKELKCNMNWSKILVDPEVLIKNAAKEKKPVDFGESCTSGLINLDMQGLNPTDAMVDVYNKFMDRQNNSYGISPNGRDDSSMDYVEGYTAAMMKVYNKQKRENSSIVQKKKKSSAKLNVKLKNKKASAVDVPTKVKTLKKVKLNQLKAKQLKRVYSLRG